MSHWIADHAEQTAVSFLAALSPISGIFADTRLPSRSLFRGVGDQSYRLFPTAFRDGVGSYRWHAHKYKWPFPTQRQQIQAEFSWLRSFVEAADQQGHAIPEDSQAFRSALDSLDESLSSLTRQKMPTWPPPILWSSLGLAQHYGAPTRLLDWSLSPYVAAYFAATSALKRKLPDGQLSVWVISRSFFEVSSILSPEGASENTLSFRMVTVPGAGNANLRAQRGVFLVYRQFGIDLESEFKPKAYDEVLAKEGPLQSATSPILFNVRLPQTEAPELLRLLAFKGVTGATVLPGLDGAAALVREQNQWPTFESQAQSPHFNKIMRSLLGEPK